MDDVDDLDTWYDDPCPKIFFRDPSNPNSGQPLAEYMDSMVVLLATESAARARYSSTFQLELCEPSVSPAH